MSFNNTTASTRPAGVRRTTTRFHPEYDVDNNFEDQLESAFKRYGGAQRYGTCSRQSIERHMLSLNAIVNTVVTLDLTVWLSMVLGCVLTYICVEYEIYWNIQLALVISPIVFPLAFSINESYRRREKVLDDMAMFMGAASELYWLHREWTDASGLPANHPKIVEDSISELLINLIHYVATEIPDRNRSQRLGAVYRIFSKLSQLNDEVRASKLPGNPPLCTRIIHYHNLMITAFERMRVVREYRTPRGIRGYTKMIVFFLPIFLAPYWAYLARTGAINAHDFGHRNPSCQNGNQFCDGLFEQTDFASQKWSAYFSACVCALIFGSLQTVQDKLDDPFDGIGQDDIDLHLITSWTPSALWQNPDDQRIPVLEATNQDSGHCCPSFMAKSYNVVKTEPAIDEEALTPPPNADTLPPIMRQPSFSRSSLARSLHSRSSLHPRTPDATPPRDRAASAGEEGGGTRPSRQSTLRKDDDVHVQAGAAARGGTTATTQGGPPMSHLDVPGRGGEGTQSPAEGSIGVLPTGGVPPTGASPAVEETQQQLAPPPSAAVNESEV